MGSCQCLGPRPAAAPGAAAVAPADVAGRVARGPLIRPELTRPWPAPALGRLPHAWAHGWLGAACLASLARTRPRRRKPRAAAPAAGVRAAPRAAAPRAATDAGADVVERWVQSQIRGGQDRRRFDVWLAQRGLRVVGEAPTPARRQEPWRYTDLRALFDVAEAAHAPPAPPPGVLREAVLSLLEKPSEDVSRLVFIDGIFVSDFAHEATTACSVSLVGGSDAWSSWNSDVKARTIGLLSLLPGRDIFAANGRDSLGCAKLAAVNQSLFGDCAFVCCPELEREKTAQPPLKVELCFVTTGSSVACCFPRVLVDVGKHRRVQVVESHVSLSPSDGSLSNGLCRVVVGEGAGVEHDLLQQKGAKARFIESVTAEVAAGGAYRLRVVQTGARAARVNAAIALEGEAATCKVIGTLLSDDSQQLDLHSLIHHRVPSCRSHQEHKNVVAGASECIFKGSIRVDREAQMTDSSQICRTLLLTRKARVKAMPSLQIRADDVQCSHGAAITELDKNQIFYMMSRGLDAQGAKRLLLVAFPQDLLGGLEAAAPKAYHRVLAKLHSMAEAGVDLGASRTRHPLGGPDPPPAAGAAAGAAVGAAAGA